MSFVFQSGFQSGFQSDFQAISSLSVPYVSPVSGGLRAGEAILIQGAVPSVCESFVVSLKCGESEGDDIAFQIKPQFSSNCMVLNSRLKGLWGNEKKLALPLKKGNNFDLIIAINSENYQVYLNGCEVGQFQHSIPLKGVTALHIGGDVTLTNVVFMGNWTGSSNFGQGEMMTMKSFGKHSSAQKGSWTFECGSFQTTQATNLTGTKTVHPEIKLPVTNLVQNPALPYVGPVAGGLRAGMALYLQGVVPTNADQFAINFKTGESDEDDIAFHFSPRMGSKVAMNSFRNGGWQTEESASENPFTKGDAFEMFIVPKPEGYQVYVNGKEHYMFKHRIPLENVKALNILGHVAAKHFGFIENWSIPSFTKEAKTTVSSLGSSHWGLSPTQSEVLHPVQNPILPYVGTVPGGLKAGMALYLQGVVPTNADQFAINFKTGQSDKDDIAFHFNPRMGSKVAMNSFRNGGWQTEESASENPFKKGDAFEMFIVPKPEGYQVCVNGKEHYMFKHRIPLENVKALNILGHVAAKLFGFIENWSIPSFTKEAKTTVTSLGSSHWGLSPTQSEVLQPVQNPILPYVGTIPGGLRAGMALYLQGVVPTNADQFAINFKTGQSDKDDIAFHFNPRMGSKVAMNSFRNGGWQTEESASENPFKKGDAFEMFIVPKPEGYQVCVNGKEHYMFKHRIPLENVKALNILGHVAAKLFGFIENWSIPSFTKEAKTTVTSLGSSHWGLSPTQSEVLHPVQNPILPYVGTIPGGLRAGMALYLQGVVPTNADQFAINFKTGQSDKDDIAFHFNPRMGSKVAMNSFRNGGWQTEESASENPFKKGDAFEMFIVPKPEGYQVYVNGKEHYMFKHRIPLENVKALNILGHVAAKLFGYIENWSIPSFTKEAKTTVSSLGSSHWGLSPTQSEVLHPVQNPILPYVGTIPGGLRAGMALYLQGVVSTNADLFAINFKTGQSDKDDIAFHFNPRMGSKVAMNSFRNGAWQTEESASENPFKKGDAFEMFIVPKPEGYQVYVNGKEHYMFKHRIPLEKVTSLNILGHVAAKLFGFIENWSIPSFTKEAKTTVTSLGSSHWGLSPTQSEVLHPVQNPILPYVGTIPGGLRAGMALYLQGVVSTNADLFAINFKTGQSDKDDIAFHFNPRMGSKVAMNSFRNGAWQTEESASENPFKKGDAFEMFIVPKPEGYQVYVNGKEHYMFKHRIPLEKVTSLNILGHVAAKLFGFIENWSIPSFTKEAKTTVTSLGSSHWGLSPTQSEVLHPVQNPILPYVGTIPGGLRAGMALYLQGVVSTNADLFAINFKTGQSDKDDIAFHFNPRMGSKVAMNSFRNGAWQTEESASENPFKKGDAFEMFIVPKPEGYQVYVNGKEHYMFKHRIPLEKVTSLNILGHIAAKLFGFIENWSIPSFTKEAKTTVTSLGSSHWGLSPTQSEVLHPVQNPILPYVGTIPGGLRAGMALYLQGVVPTNADQFAINFKTGQSDKDDIAFHFNPRMGSKVAMNSFRNGGWQTEESASENPFKKGDAFEMFIVPKPEGYQVYVNGKEHYMFKHRIPLENVKALNILGHVAAKLFGYIENWSIPSFTKEAKTTVSSLGSSHWGLSPTQSEVLHPVQNPILPYVGTIPGGLRAGMALYLQGVVPTNADLFAINFKTGQSDKDDIAFHFNPRMGSKVAMNSFRNGAWQTEESASENPFKKGDAFEMFIVPKPEGYQVYVNGKEHYMFKHRIPLEKVTSLNILGHVAAKLFGFIENWSIPSFTKEAKTTVTSLGSSHWGLSPTQSEVLHPVQNPILPYVGTIPGGLRAGMALYLQGVVPTNADQFAINFKTGQSDKDDIAFHFSPRMGSKVAMNSFRNGGWQTEESASENPFKKGDAFEMFIVPKPEGYQVYVNGKEHYMFKHRIPLENVKALNILGHIAAKLFGFIENWSIPSFTKEAKTTVTSLGSSHWGLSPTQSEVLHPVQNPILPYVGTIPGGLRAGMALYLQGVVPTNADQFAINFKTGQSDKDDIAFHFNPRMGSKVAMNSFRNGGWQTEESASENPFKKGDAFEMFIVPKPEGYQVYVNGKEHYMFKHRIPLENVKALNILGHVAAKLFGFIENWSIPSFTNEAKTTVTSLGSSHWGLSPTQSEVLHPVQNPILPYVGTIPGGLRAGMALYLQGVVPTNADQFAINFKTGQSDKDDIAFHFNPRMGSKVAMNSFRNGGWQTEESASENPFKKGDAFEMFIVPKPEGYQVYVNGKEHYMFKHRIPLENVKALNILGHVAAKLFGFIENWSIPSFTKEAKTTVTSLGSSHWGLSPTQSEVLHPVQNPILPYVGTIPGGLRAGMAMYLQGVVPTNADQFAINFKTGQSDKDDIAFHFNPRMGSKVAMNSFRNGGWQTEESASENPFKKGDAFEMFIVPKPEGYQVFVNGKEHYMFKHRIPLEKVTSLNILGHIAAKLFGFIENWRIPSFTKEAKTTITSLSSSHWGLSPTQSEVLHPVQNPILPYVGTIPGGLRAGMALYLQGVVPTNADQFAINFQTGQSDKDDIAFHFNPRIGSKVAMNSFRNGGWQTEESASENPFKKGDAFEMFIVPKPEGYQVYVNGKEHYMFKHRIPLENVKALNILGHIAAKLFGFIENWSIPSFNKEAKTTVTSLGSSHWGLSPTQSEVLHPVQNPILPYVGTIPGGLRAGMALYLQGVVPTNADQFAINFKTGQSDKDDIAFHFNPRMGSKVAMNSFRNGGWQTEESASENPFKKGDAFEMFIVPKPEGYQVYVNGKEHYMFKHRIPLENVKALNILGHVAAKLFGFIENWSIPSFTKEAKTTVTSLGSSHWGLSPTQSEVLHPVQNPILPYVGTIPGGLRAGMALYLQGVVPTNADQFAINFKTGQSDKDDIAFHFNPRMGSKVAMNSFRSGGWQTEESASENPFKKGDAFEMFIVPKPEGYQVYVNGKEHYMFKHRIPLENVKALNILGHVAAKLFGFIENWSIPSFTKEAKTTVTSLGRSHWGLSPTQSEVLHPVQNPILPYVGTIPGGLRAGMALYLQGVVPTNADQFAINFKTGQSDKDDIAFHFNPRMGSKVAMNSFRNGGWQTEESASENPFKKGDAFEMFIVPKPEGYQVFVNGKEHYMFKHRIPLEKVTSLNILGHIAAKLFGFIENWRIPSFTKEAKTTITSLSSSHWGLSPTQSEVLHPVQNPILPYVGTIPGGLRAGMALYLQGVVPTNADQFAINFQTGQSDKDDIAFHFNPRMGSKVAMNSFRNGGWQTEESASENPFKKGDAFEMFIVPKPEGYQVYVNGKEHYMFKHRVPLEKVSALHINGNVALNFFGFIENWSISSFTKEAKTTITSLGSTHWSLSTIQSEILHPVHSPTLPYVGPIAGGLRAGMALYMQGVVAHNADRFSINFKTGQSDKDDIAFHFNPRMGNKVIMNSFRKGGWQTEEYASENPFKKGEAFDILIVITSDGYKVHVKGQQHCMFKHRIPLEKVTTLHILGNVSISFFGFIMDK